MQFHVAPNGSGYQRENDVIHTRSAVALYSFNLGQRDFGPGELLRSAVQNIEAQTLRGCAEFREQMGELVRGDIAAGRGETLCHARYVGYRSENSLDEFGIGIDAAVG